MERLWRAQVSLDSAWNVVAKRVEAPDGSDLFVILCGFSCKCASHLQTLDIALRKHCISRSLGSTGSTFLALKLMARKHRPRWLVLENVPGLATTGQHHAVIAALKDVGYVTTIVQRQALFCLRACPLSISCFENTV